MNDETNIGIYAFQGAFLFVTLLIIFTLYNFASVLYNFYFNFMQTYACNHYKDDVY